MTRNRPVKKWLAGLALMLVLALTAALPALAVSDNTQAVLDQLAVLQRADISPEWLPDIRANQAHVQQLLTLYEACSADERAEFTNAQNADLRAYFEALYSVQGKNPADVDGLFAGGAASSSQPPASSEPASSSEPDSSSEPESVSEPESSSVASASSQSESSAASEEDSSSLPASSALPASSSTAVAPPAGVTSGSDGSGMPSATYPPQTPKPSGWAALFGNAALGVILLVVLLGLAVVLFLRFLAALRTARAALPDDADEAQRAQELYGENYAQKLEEVAEEPRPVRKPARPPVAKAPPPTTPSEPLPLKRGKPKQAPVPAEPTPSERPALLDMAEAAAQKQAVSQGQAVYRQQAVNTPPAAPAPATPPAEAPVPAEAPLSPGRAMLSGSGRPTPRRGQAAAPPPAVPAEAPATPVDDAPTAPPQAPAEPPAPPVKRGRGRPPGSPNRKPPPKPSFLDDDDSQRQPPVTLRSFGTPQRDGRPAKMTFRQGDPNDLDAIDE